MEKEKERIALGDTITESEQILNKIEEQKILNEEAEKQKSLSALETLTSFFNLKGNIEVLLKDFASIEEKENLDKYFANLEYAQVNLINHENEPSDNAIFEWVEQTLKYAINILKKKQYHLDHPDEPIFNENPSEDEKTEDDQNQIQLIKEDLKEIPEQEDSTQEIQKEEPEIESGFFGKIFKGFFGKKEEVIKQKIQAADDYEEKTENNEVEEKMITIEQANETQIENFKSIPENLKKTMKIVMKDVLRNIEDEEKVIISSTAAFIHHRGKLTKKDADDYFNEDSDVDADFVGTPENIAQAEKNLNKLANPEDGSPVLVYQDKVGNIPGFNKTEINGKFGKATRFQFYYKDPETGKITDAEAFGSPEGNGLVQLKNIKQTITQVKGINITGERETKRTYLPVIGTELANCEIQRYVNAFKNDSENTELKEKIGARGKKLADMWGVSFVMGLINAWKQERNAYLECENQSPQMLKTIEIVDKTMAVLNKERRFFINIYLKGVNEEDREQMSTKIENDLENADVSLEDIAILSEALKSSRKEMTKASVNISNATFEEIPQILHKIDDEISLFEEKLNSLNEDAGIMKMMLIGKLFTEFMQPVCKMAISKSKVHRKEIMANQDGKLTKEQELIKKDTLITTAKLNKYLVQFLSYEIKGNKPFETILKEDNAADDHLYDIAA